MLKAVSRSAEDRGAKNGMEKPSRAEVRRTGRARIEKVGGRRGAMVVEGEERRVVLWRVRRSRKGRRNIVRFNRELKSVDSCLSIGSAKV